MIVKSPGVKARACPVMWIEAFYWNFPNGQPAPRS